MTPQLFTNLSEFDAKIRPFLLQNEAANNLILGVLTSLDRQPKRRRNRPLLALVEDEGGIQLVGVMTPPRKLMLAGEVVSQEAIGALVDALKEAGKAVPAVFGPEAQARWFAEAWCGDERPYRPGTPQAIHKLTQVNDLTLPPGNFRTPHPEELELIADWIFGFYRDVETDHTPSLTNQIAAQLMQNRDIYVWADEDDTPKTMAARSRPTENGISINMVFTPESERGKGYATACVASLSQKLLDDGYAFCTLFTDLKNPTSNHIYQKIGYKRILDLQDYFWT